MTTSQQPMTPSAFAAQWKAVSTKQIAGFKFAETQERVARLVLSGRKVTKATPKDQDPNAVFNAFLTLNLERAAA